MRVLLLFLFLSGQLMAETFHRNPEFPVKNEMRTRVDFWKKVYTQITTNESFLHDMEDLTLIYGKFQAPKGRRARRKFSNREKAKIKKLLQSIRRKNYQNLNSAEKDLVKIIGKRSKNELKRMQRTMRMQYGLKDRYFKGLQRSYAYLYHIEKVFDDLSLPHELTYLPHVESSFNYHAYSKVGAAGIWQFMRSTARHYRLKVNYLVDERRDPIKATYAAARLLKDNYRILNSWPLALTAYNHGVRSLQRAVKRVKTTDINTIIEKYDGRRFGFASKNFYATFMATVEISENPEKYFPSFKKPAPYKFSTLKLDRPYTIKQIIKQTGLSKNTIRDYNPSIRKTVYRSYLHLPIGFELRVPQVGKKQIASYKSSLKKIKKTKEDLEFDRRHIISRGETLYDISRMYRVSMSDLISFNNISNPSRIYAGMRLSIPGKKGSTKKKTVKPKEPVKEPVVVASSKEEQPKKEQAKPEVSIAVKPVNKAPKEWSPQVSLESYELEAKKVSRDVYRITIETEETLGHYAEWAGVKTQKIRNLNRLRFGRDIVMGRRLKIPLSESRLKEFKAQRGEYHLSIQEDFYDAFKVEGSQDYKVRRGDTLVAIINKLNVPYWLLRKSQPNGKLSSNIQAGQKIIYPIVKSKSEESSLVPKDDEESEE